VLVVACNSIVGFGDLEKTNEVTRADAGGSSGGGGGGGEGGRGEPGPGNPDAGGDSGPVGPAPPRCNKANAFGPPELATEFDGQENTNRAKLTPDELDAFWVIGNQGNRTLRNARRTAIGAPWTVRTITTNPPIGGLVSVTVSGLKIYYHADNTSNTLLVATRADRETAAFVNGRTITSDPLFFSIFIVESDDFAFYDKPKPSSTEIRLVRAPLLSSGVSTNQAVAVANLDRPGEDDWDPALSGDQKTIFFMSGPDGPGVQQWMARRNTITEDFGTPIRVPELEDQANDHVSWVSNDECIVYLTRSAHIYSSKRPL